MSSDIYGCALWKQNKSVTQSCFLPQVPEEWMKTMKIIHLKRSGVTIMCSIMHCPGKGYQR